MSAEQFTIFGTKYRCGSYLLLIHLSKPIQLAFGRFQQRKLFTLPEGEYLYIGSALGKSGSPLAQRLLRHASRSYAQQPHAIRAPMVTLFMQEGLIEKQALNAHEKKIHWHIDYLLDRPETEIKHVVIIRSPLRVEPLLSSLLEPLKETAQLAPRLGAQDTKNSTHLLRITDQQAILNLLKKAVPELLQLTSDLVP